MYDGATLQVKKSTVSPYFAGLQMAFQSKYVVKKITSPNGGLSKASLLD